MFYNGGIYCTFSSCILVVPGVWLETVTQDSDITPCLHPNDELWFRIANLSIDLGPWWSESSIRDVEFCSSDLGFLRKCESDDDGPLLPEAGEKFFPQVQFGKVSQWKYTNFSGELAIGTWELAMHIIYSSQICHRYLMLMHYILTALIMNFIFPEICCTVLVQGRMSATNLPKIPAATI